MIVIFIASNLDEFFIEDIPLNVEQTTLLFTPTERSLIGQTVHNEALRLGLVPTISLSTTASHPIQSQGLICNYIDFRLVFVDIRNESFRAIE